MAELGMPLCVHGEATDPSIDIFDREAAFVESVLKPLHADLPELKIIMEHITTKQGVEFVLNGGANVGGTITPQHLMYNRNRPFSSSSPANRAPRRRSRAPLLLPPHPEARGASPGADPRDSIGLQAIVFGNRLRAARARNEGMQEGVRWVLQRVSELGVVRGNLRGERVFGEAGGVRGVGMERGSEA